VRRYGARGLAGQVLTQHKNEAKRRKDADAVKLLELRIRCLRIANGLYKRGF
jgi:hypothetical protein